MLVAPAAALGQMCSRPHPTPPESQRHALALALRLYPCRALPMSSTHVPGAPWWSKREPSKPCADIQERIAGGWRRQVRRAQEHGEGKATSGAAGLSHLWSSLHLTVKCGSPQPCAAAGGAGRRARLACQHPWEARGGGRRSHRQRRLAEYTLSQEACTAGHGHGQALCQQEYAGWVLRTHRFWGEGA